MTWLHTWVGLIVCWILYFMFVTGTLGYFDSEIDRWMQPEQAPSPQTSFADAVAVARTRLVDEAMGAERWFITPPDEREHPHLEIFWQMPREEGEDIVRGNEDIDLATGEPLGEPVRATGGGQVLYRMHYILHYIDRAITYPYLIGLITLIMFIGMVTGVIIHRNIFRDFFTFRLSQGQRSWLDMHNMLSVTSLPFQLMITYSGLIFMVLNWMPGIALGSYGFDTSVADEVVAEATGNVPLEASGTPAELVDFAPIIADASARWGSDSLGRMEVRHPGDAASQITLYRQEDASRIPSRVIYSGVTGEVLDDREDYIIGPIKVASTFLGLHEGLFAGTLLRWFYFLSGLLGTGMIATGAIHYTSKRRKRNENEPQSRGYRFVECLNIGTIMGLPVGIAAYFLANRLLPLGMADRAAWEVHCMFLVWGACLLYPLVRSRIDAWRDLAALAAGAFALVPVINMLTTDNAHLLVTLPAGNWILAGFDLTALAAALFFGTAAWLIGRKRASMKTAPEASPRAAARADALA
ncbi:MAG: PepSY-associated TM helix domain-containing protein [Pseudomonadota bacterium]